MALAMGKGMAAWPVSLSCVASSVQGSVTRAAAQVGDLSSGNWKEQPFTFVVSLETSACHCKTPEPLVSVCRMKLGSWRAA